MYVYHYLHVKCIECVQNTIHWSSKNVICGRLRSFNGILHSFYYVYRFSVCKLGSSHLPLSSPLVHVHFRPPPPLSLLPSCIMPVSGFNSVVIGHSTVTAPPATTAPSPPSSMTSTSPSNSSTPSPINSLPHKNAQQQQNGNHLLPDDMDVCNGLEKPSPAGSRQLLTDESDFNLMDDFSNHLSISPKPPQQAQSSFDREKSEMRSCLSMFNDWSTGRQSDFVEQLIVRMSFHQHERLYSILIPMLQRDFITALPGEEGVGFFSVCFILFACCTSPPHILYLYHSHTSTLSLSLFLISLPLPPSLPSSLSFSISLPLPLPPSLSLFLSSCCACFV